MLKSTLFFILIVTGFNWISVSAFETESYDYKVGGAATCEICSLVLGVAKNMLENNYTDDEIIGFIEKQLCARLGALNSTCVSYVEADGKQILYELANKLDPTIICKRIGLCSSKKPIYINSLNCTLCKVVFKQIQDVLKSNETQEKILQLIEQDFCNTTSVSSEVCKEIINQFGTTVLEYLANKVDPEKSCTFIGMCQNVSNSRKTYQSIPFY